MISSRRDDIQLLGGVVDGVNSPQEGEAVAGPVEGVGPELSHDQGQAQLEHQRPAVRPEAQTQDLAQPAQAGDAGAEARGRDQEPCRLAGHDRGQGVEEVHLDLARGDRGRLRWGDLLQEQHHASREQDVGRDQEPGCCQLGLEAEAEGGCAADQEERIGESDQPLGLGPRRGRIEGSRGSCGLHEVSSRPRLRRARSPR